MQSSTASTLSTAVGVLSPPDGPAPALFILPYESTVGYAIAPLIAAFFQAASALNDGRMDQVHFAFSKLTGPAEVLPPDFSNVIEFDSERSTRASRARLADYVRSRNVSLVMLLDVQPVTWMAKLLHSAGVRAVISYWGAPISPARSGLALLLRRMQVALGRRGRVESLIFESHAMAQLAVRGRGCPTSMLDVVPTGTDVGRFRSIPDEARRRYVHDRLGVDRAKKIVIFSGHAHERKGIGTLVDAAIRLLRDEARRDVCFVVCGDRGDERLQYEARLREAGVLQDFRFVGYREDIARLMSGAHIGVVPSSGWDSFPMSALEMAASGLPVVGSRLGGIPETLVEHETGLLFEPGSGMGLAATLRRLLDDDELRVRLGAAGRRRVTRELTVDAQRIRLLEVFRRRLRS